MKKLTGIVLAIVAACIPVLTVLAITGNYFVYKEGDIVNFYYNDDDAALGEVSEEAGRATIIIKDDGADSQFVKVLLFGLVTDANITAVDYTNGVDGFVGREENAATAPINKVISLMNEQNYQDGYVKDKNVWGNVGFITLEELEKTFGAKKGHNDENGNPIYTIDPEAKMGSKGKTVREVLNSTIDNKSFLEALMLDKASTDANIEFLGHTGEIARVGFFTSTPTADGKIYAVDITLNADEDIDKIEVKAVKVPNNDVATNVLYSLVPTAYFDKTYDCTKKETPETPEEKPTSSCYLCGEEYVWTEDGTQGEECKVVTKIKSESECVKPVQTGVEEYLPELIAVLALGGISIVLLKKKDLFKSI